MEAEFEKFGGKGNISVKEFISDGYDLVIDSVIRPPRAKYSVDELGPREYQLEDPVTNAPIFVTRTDRVVMNELYLHSNVGSRKDVLRLRDHALRLGFSVFAFDFSGSGVSDGIYVTMGWLESSDLKYILDDLDSKSTVLSVSLFAHTMGCYPALLNVASRFQQTAELVVKGGSIDAIPQVFRKWNIEPYAKRITGLVLDGAYSNMHQCIDDLVLNVKKEGFGAPKLMLKAAARFVQKSVEKRTAVHMDFLRPVDLVAFIKSTPALLVCGADDKYVGPAHTHELAAAYGGPCAKLIVDHADHYSPRQSDVYQVSLLFLLQQIDATSHDAAASALLSPTYQAHLRDIVAQSSRTRR
ncbi:hypothetical protein DYB32_000483 [Aphanomyces invadans]|uniref:Serine aminopeptidase S33 domain-containing protein n=1 Tax=Aphanomyces invadans TaxID=157072 RepID=A0A3R6VI46_9STRA|nr:hypothetical protein DYB32_000483 [Aphanomyces invadans]